MGLVGVSCSRGYISLADHYQCMQQPDHPCEFTTDVLDQMTGPNEERVASGVKFSPSSMLGCRRQAILTRDHDWYLNVSGAWAMQRGHIVHGYAEKFKPPRGSIGAVREVRLRSMVQTSKGFEWFAGKMDAIIFTKLETIPLSVDEVVDLNVVAKTVLHVKIIDYKSKGDIGHGPDTHLTNKRLEPTQAAAQRDHQQQINLYAWLVRNELANWLNARYRPEDPNFLGWNEYAKLNTTVQDVEHVIPWIDEVVVDELEIQYVDFAKARRFTSAATLHTRGRRMPDHKTYERLELLPIFRSSHDYLTRWITRHIEMAYQAEAELPPPITGEESKKFCYRCPVRSVCYDVGKAEGREMAEQAPL